MSNLNNLDLAKVQDLLSQSHNQTDSNNLSGGMHLPKLGGKKSRKNLKRGNKKHGDKKSRRNLKKSNKKQKK